MKVLSLLMTVVILLSACGNNDNSKALESPASVQPPSDAITDSTKIVNDSVIVPVDSPAKGAVITHEQAPKEQ